MCATYENRAAAAQKRWGVGVGPNFCWSGQILEKACPFLSDRPIYNSLEFTFVQFLPTLILKDIVHSHVALT